MVLAMLGGVAVIHGCARSDTLEPRARLGAEVGTTGGRSTAQMLGHGTSGSSSSSASSSSSSGQVGQCPNYVKPDVVAGGRCPANLPLICSGTVGMPISCVERACPAGFTCNDGGCELNGSLSPLQITLSWETPEDMDLHVVEPVDGQIDGGGCEIYYANTGPRLVNPNVGSCPPTGWLDLDSNMSCELDNVDIENVLYPTGIAPPSGIYLVRADFWSDCADAGAGIPDFATMDFAIQVRANGLEFTACGTFTPANSDQAGEGGGVTMAAFRVPPPLSADGSCDCTQLPCDSFLNPNDTNLSIPLFCDPRACACLP